ncbi:MAG: FAD-dependent oxidoreductase [Bacteroidota bacterium]
MKRRSFIKKGIGLAASASALGAAKPLKGLESLYQAPEKSSEILVIGAGIFGVWTAFYLQELGAKVSLVDAYGPGNSRASSGGESRILRSDYGGKLMYSRLNVRAYELWNSWQESWGRNIMYPTGRLKMGDDSLKQKALKERASLQSLGVESDILNQKEIRYRWPQINAEGLEAGVYYPGGKGGSTLMAREAIQLVAEQFVRKGGTLILGKARPGTSASGEMSQLLVNETDQLSADTYIFACGPWMPRLFPDIFLPRIKVVRRDVLFVGIPAGDDRFSYPRFPVWSFSNPEDARYYGVPDLRGRGLKVAPWPDNNGIDLDRDDRIVNMYELKRVHEFVAKRFPGLKEQPILETRVCQLSFSAEEDFIIDRHPAMSNVWFACAGSGHAFKHGPALGEYIARRIYAGEQFPEYDEAFKLR